MQITVRWPMIACMFVDAGLGAAIMDPFVAQETQARWQFAIRPLVPALTMDTWPLTRAWQPLSRFARTATGVLRTMLREGTPAISGCQGGPPV